MGRWRKILVLVLAGIVALPASSQAPDDPGKRIALWQGGVPGFESRASIPEESESYWTKSVNNPSITYFAPWPGRETGAAVIVVPGGAH